MEQALRRPLVFPASFRAFVSFVHMSVTVQGALIVATGLLLLAVDYARYTQGGAVTMNHDSFRLMPALLAALYLMASEKILRDRLVLKKIHEAPARPSRGLPLRSAGLDQLYVKTRSLYHLLMLCCFLLYALGHLAPRGPRTDAIFFHVTWLLLVVLYCEFLLCNVTQHAGYAGLVLETLTPDERAARWAPTGTSLESAVRSQVGQAASEELDRVVLQTRTFQGAAVVVWLALLLSPAPAADALGRWFADGVIIAVGLTFACVNLRRERFLRFASVLHHELKKAAPGAA